MCDPVSLATGAVSLAGKVSEAGTAGEQARIAGEQADLQKKMWKKQVEQQERRYKTGREDLGAGEKELYALTEKSPEMMTQLSKDITQGGTEAQRQAGLEQNLALAQQGVGGAQASRLRGRQAGAMGKEMQRELTKLAYEDLLTRRGARTGFQTQKGLSGQSMAGSV